MTWLDTRCKKILGTRPKMTGVRYVDLVSVGTHLPLTRHFVPTSPAWGEVKGLLCFTRNDGRVLGEVTRLLRCARNDDRE